MTNELLTIDQLSQISGGGRQERQERRAIRREIRAQRRHDRRTGCPDCPYYYPEDCPNSEIDEEISCHDMDTIE
ncbi:CCRG-2 family RiPP [Prochlorococcus marinus]|uniref:CCRG-2 family RiPP n=1 Tax=Prochlorococcus marinus TaxID=1219 RepID=UPI0007BB5A93|nr:hypothetical protein PMIT1320_01652 [Prochlorococcus marinus str. MIT 1320]